MSATNKGPSRRAAIIAAVHVFAVCTASAGAYVALADEPGPAALPSAEVQAPGDLEQAFWVCDYVATAHGIEATPVALCSEVTARLQEQKFAGDFGQLLEWWRQNKPVQHARLDAASITNAALR